MPSTKETKRRRLFHAILPLTAAGAGRDALAGLTLAAMNVPQALGYTKIAGMPVVTGLYTLLLPLLAFAAFGSSRFLVVAADSATAAILASGLAPMAAPGSERYVALAGLVALLTAVYLLAARLFRLGFLADFLSQTVLVGFLAGVGIQVGIAVLGEMLGLASDARGTLAQLAELVPRAATGGSPRRRPVGGGGGGGARLPRRCSAPAWNAGRGGRRDGRQRGLRFRRPRHPDDRAGRRRPAAADPAGARLERHPAS